MQAGCNAGATHSHHTSGYMFRTFENMFPMSWECLGRLGTPQEIPGGRVAWVACLGLTTSINIFRRYVRTMRRYVCIIRQALHSHCFIIAPLIANALGIWDPLIGKALPRSPVLIGDSLHHRRDFVYYVILAFLQCAGGAGIGGRSGRHNVPYRKLDRECRFLI